MVVDKINKYFIPMIIINKKVVFYILVCMHERFPSYLVHTQYERSILLHVKIKYNGTVQLQWHPYLIRNHWKWKSNCEIVKHAYHVIVCTMHMIWLPARHGLQNGGQKKEKYNCMVTLFQNSLNRKYISCMIYLWQLKAASPTDKQLTFIKPHPLKRINSLGIINE